MVTKRSIGIAIEELRSAARVAYDLGEKNRAYELVEVMEFLLISSGKFRDGGETFGLERVK